MWLPIPLLGYRQPIDGHVLLFSDVRDLGTFQAWPLLAFDFLIVNEKTIETA